MGLSDEVAEAPPVPVVQAAVDVAPFAMLVADRWGRVLRSNQKWGQLSGQSGNDALALGWLEALEPEAARRLYRLTEAVAAGGSPEVSDFELSTARGPRWTRWWVDKRDIGEAPLLFMAVADIHDDRRSRLDLEHLATHDPLTGLLNRRFFAESVDQALKRTDRWGGRVALLYIDLDGFKEVNDVAGHTTGDRVLAAVAGRIRLAVRASDLVARLGGDEFGVLIERVGDEAEARHVAGRIRRSIDGSVELDGSRWSVSASIGVALGDVHSSLASMLEVADADMYAVKRAGRPAPAAPPPDMGALRDSMEAVRRALESLLGPDMALELRGG